MKARPKCLECREASTGTCARHRLATTSSLSMSVHHAAALFLLHVHDGEQPTPAGFMELEKAARVLKAAGIDRRSAVALSLVVIQSSTPEQIAECNAAAATIATRQQKGGAK